MESLWMSPGAHLRSPPLTHSLSMNNAPGSVLESKHAQMNQVRPEGQGLLGRRTCKQMMVQWTKGHEIYKRDRNA